MQIRKFENLHIFLWLIKDLCWVTLSQTLGMIMIIPTITLAIYITLIARKDHSELFHNLAVCFWICANSVWMTGEFYYNDGLRMYATAFFFLGLASIIYYYIRVLMKRVFRKGDFSS